jgi:hypothetical protein
MLGFLAADPVPERTGKHAPGTDKRKKNKYP